ARNPSVEKERLASTSEEEMKLVRHYNSGESYSLLKCKMPYTLAIKQHNMQYKTLGDKKEVAGFLDRFNNLGKLFSKGEWQDVAAHNAHNLAEGLAKAGFPEVYVLHCKHCSYVTMGSFKSLDDPQLVAMQNYLENRFKLPAYQQLDLLPRPLPMPVPGIA